MLTARANKPVLGRGQGELVWLKLPEDDKRSEEPWEEVVLAEGPDVMFEVTDLDVTDGSLDVISAHFFGQKISVINLKATRTEHGQVVVQGSQQMVVETAGKPYGLCLADLSTAGLEGAGEADEAQAVGTSAGLGLPPSSMFTHLLVSTHECAYDVPSAVSMILGTLGGRYPVLKSGGAEQGGTAPRAVENSLTNPYEVGGSLFAYEIPPPSSGAGSGDRAGRTRDLRRWKRKTLFQGFKVRGWGGIFSPGAPGFPYVFRMGDKGGGAGEQGQSSGLTHEDGTGGTRGPPLILLAGDCTGSAYIFSPHDNTHRQGQEQVPSVGEREALPEYELAFEVQCGATVGSAAVSDVGDGTGDVEIVVPSYELNKVHLYRLHAEDDDDDNNDNGDSDDDKEEKKGQGPTLRGRVERERGAALDSTRSGLLEVDGSVFAATKWK